MVSREAAVDWVGVGSGYLHCKETSSLQFTAVRWLINYADASAFIMQLLVLTVHCDRMQLNTTFNEH